MNCEEWKTKLKEVFGLQAISNNFVFSDFDLNPKLRYLEKRVEELRPSAVLVPFVIRGDVLNIILTKRSDKLSKHAGQIAFPGGRVDAEDENIIKTALRESWEEIGLDPKMVEIIGFGDNYQSRTGYLVSPIMGFVNPEASFKINPDEVDYIFEVPFEFFLNECNYRNYAINAESQNRRFYSATYEGNFIWGVTAGILHSIAYRLGYVPHIKYEEDTNA